MKSPMDENSYYNANKNSFTIVRPKSFNDVENAIAMLRDNNTLIAYLDNLKAEDAQRVMDLLSGAAFALDGSVFEIQKDIFMITPVTANIISND